MSEPAPQAVTERPPAAAPDRLVYIGGSGRSGSTLLDLLLSNHTAVQSVGEIHRLNLYARDNMEPCTCGEPVADCPFWCSVEDVVRDELGWSADRRPLLEHEIMLVRDRSGPANGKLQAAALVYLPSALAMGVARTITPQHYSAIRQSELWYRAIRRVTGAPVLVESTKDARRLKLLSLTQPDTFRLIHMSRDGRGVAASDMRRTGATMEQAAFTWADALKRSLIAQRGVPANRQRHVRYEDLCADPEGVMRGVLEFLGLSWEPGLLELRKEVSHNIGGNPMRFRKDETKITLDERWKQQLTEDDLRTFDRIAGPVNRQLGYD